METQREKPVSLLFKWIIFHPLTEVYYSKENNIEKYDIYTYSLKIFEFKYDTINKKYDMWREQVLFALYEEFEILTNVKPDYLEVYKYLQEKINDDQLEAVMSNIRNLPICTRRRKIR